VLEPVMASMSRGHLHNCAVAGVALLLAATAVISGATTGTSSTVVIGTKTASGSFVESGNVTYTIVLTNIGGAAQQDNPGHEFTDVLPPGLTLISATATSGTAVATIASNTATWDGSIAAGASVTITISASIKTGTMGTTISNQGTISYDNDDNGTNESSAVTDDPGTPASNDPTSFVVGTTPVTLQSFDVD
jgi:uncharacterized repeat protein (TIGR01451 family)